MKKWTTTKSTEIFRVLSGRVNTYLICHEKGCILVDCGMNRMVKTLLKNINTVLSDEKIVDYLFITHAHFDHCQSAAFVSDNLKARIVVHSSESYNLMTGISELPGGTMFLSKIIVKIGKKWAGRITKYPPVEPDLTIRNQGTLFNTNDLKIIHTPGHSANSMCLIVDNEIAITGDTLFGVFPGKAFPPFANDVEELIESWGILLETDCKIFLPGHGRPIKRKTLEREFKNRCK